MKRMVMWMVAFFGVGGCTMDPTTAATAIGAVTGMVDLLRKFGVLTMIALALVLQGGCAGKTGSVSDGSSGMAAQQAIDVVASAEENGLQATAIVEVDPGGGINFGPGAIWTSKSKATVIIQGNIRGVGHRQTTMPADNGSPPITTP